MTDGEIPFQKVGGNDALPTAGQPQPAADVLKGPTTEISLSLIKRLTRVLEGVESFFDKKLPMIEESIEELREELGDLEARIEKLEVRLE